MKRALILCWSIAAFSVTCARENAASQTNFWQQTNGPYGVAVTKLAINASGHIFAGTPTGGVFRSTDNGLSWVQVNAGLTNTNVGGLAISASGHIFAGTNWGGVFRSTDNGASWLLRSTSIGISSLVINVSGDIFIGVWTEFDGGVSRSTDNGASWTGSALNHSSVPALAINASGHIFAGTYPGNVFRSTDNGASWTNSGLTNALDVRALAINASGHIFAGTSSGAFRSTDEGATWNPVNTGMYSTDVLALAINASGHIFAGTNQRGVFRSTDNGSSWTQINSGLTNIVVRSLAINASGTIFAGTDSGGVFQSVQSTTSVKESSPDKPLAYSLDQNYPNPFNPSTTIGFSLPRASYVTLKIFNIVGEEVTTLVSEELVAGNHTTRWDAEGIAGGVYFYRLQAGSFKEIKRLILLR